MEQHFGCTFCGGCCHDLRVPLTVREAIVWSKRGHAIELLCEALWPSDPGPGDVRAHFKRTASFPATSGKTTIRIGVTLAASFDGPCPNRHENLSCNVYERRPLVCRIYPAEIVPYIPFDTARKACPPEAWATDLPLLAKGGRYSDGSLRETITRSRALTLADAACKERVCRLLGVNAAAVTPEGYLAHRRDARQLLNALLEASAGSGSDEQQWRDEWLLVSNRSATLSALDQIGAKTSYAVSRRPADPWENDLKYLGFYADDATPR